MGRDKLPTIVTEEEFRKLIEATDKYKDKIAFLLAFGSGLRVSEVKNLGKKHIDMDDRKIMIREAKGGKDRVVPLPKGFRSSMLDYIPLDCSIRTLQRHFKQDARKAGLLEKKPDLHFHSLRHGFATRLANQGMPIHQLRTLMGHTDISTTNVYLKLNPKEALKSYEELF